MFPYMTKLNAKHTALLDSLPAMFYLVEDYNRSSCPPTVIVDADSDREVDSFHAGQSRLFETLCKAGKVEFGGGEKTNGIVRRLYAKA